MKKASSLFSILLLLAQWIFAQENFYSRIDSFKSSDFDNKKPMTIVMTTHKKLRHYRDEITPILLAKKVTLVSAQFTETNERTTINSTIETKRMKSKTVAETTQPYKADYILNFSALIPTSRGIDQTGKIMASIVDKLSGKIVVNYEAYTNTKNVKQQARRIISDFAQWLMQ